MILHVTFHQFILIILALELAEDLIVALTQGVGQHIEATAVGHADNVFGDAQLGTVFDNGVQRRNEGFGTFDAEAFGTDELLAEELLEHHGLVQFLEDLLLLVDGEFGCVAHALHTLLQPFHLLRVADEAEFGADALAVRLVEQGDNVTQLGRTQAHLVAGGEHGVQVGRSEAVAHQVQGGV